MEILQKNRGLSNYFEISGIEDAGGYELQMLLNNSMQYIPVLKYQEIDNQTLLLYQIDGKAALASYYGKKHPDALSVRELMTGIRDCIGELKEYLLSADSLLLNMNYILYDSNQNKFQFLYVPGLKNNFSMQMKSLMEDIMLIFNHQDAEGTAFFYDLYSKFLDSYFTAELFWEYISRISDERHRADEADEELVIWEKEPEPYVISEVSAGGGEGRNKEKKPAQYFTIGIAVFLSGILFYFLRGRSIPLICGIIIISILVLTGLTYPRERTEKETAENRKFDEWKAAWQEKTPIKEAEIILPTEIITGEEEKKTVTRLMPYMDKNKPPILIAEGRIVVGRLGNQVDVCVDAPGISRVHAEIERKNEVVTLMDAGSTNGTYLNHIRLAKNEKTEIKCGDIVGFAGEEYYCL